jgi:hypothetical protein
VRGYIGDLNDELGKFDFEIRSMRDQVDRSTVYAMVNSTPDSIIQGATHHSPDEIAFFRRLLDAMFETNNTRRAEVFAVRETDALHLNKNPPGEGEASTGGLTHKAAEEALAKFVEEGWLEKSRYVHPSGDYYHPSWCWWHRNNYYTLAPRGLLELSVYLTQTYGDISSSEEDSDEEEHAPRRRIKKCEACSELLTIGQRCEKLSCDVRMHEPCAQQFFRVNKDRKCPKCKTKWSGKEVVGEGAAGKLRRRVQKRAAPAPPTPRGRNRGTEDEEEGEEQGGHEQEEDEE